MIYHIIERGGRRFNFLSRWGEASVPDIKTTFEPMIDAVMKVGAPPSGDYFFVGCAPKTDIFGTPSHDLPVGTVCAGCRLTAQEVQQNWQDFWSSISMDPRDNLVLYNFKAINDRINDLRGRGLPGSAVLFLAASLLAFELYHVEHNQFKMHSWEGEAEAYDAQRGFISRGASKFGLDATNKKIALDESQNWQANHRKQWLQTHPGEAVMDELP